MVRDAIAETVNDLISTGDGTPGLMKIYDGPLHDDVDDAGGTGTLLSSLMFAPIAWNVTTETSDVHGELRLYSTLYDDNTSGTGTPTWGMVEDAEGNKLLDFECPYDMDLGPITVGGTLTISEFTLIVVPGTEGLLLGDLNLDGVVSETDVQLVQRNLGMTIGD